MHARDPSGGDRRRHRELPQAPVHADPGQQRAHQCSHRRRGRAGRRALSLRLFLHGFRAGDGVPDHRGVPPRLPRPALGIRLLEARGRGLHARGARPARAPIHDLPPVQRVRPGRATRSRGAGYRPRRPRPDRQGARRAATAPDLRLRPADPDSDPRHGHRRRHRHCAGSPRRAGPGLQHLRVGGADRRRDRPCDLGGVRERRRHARVRAPAELRGRRAAPLAVSREGPPPARLGGAECHCATVWRRPSSGCATSRCPRRRRKALAARGSVLAVSPRR